MRVALTGAGGFLGRYVLESLHERGIETVLLGRTRPVHNAQAEFVEVDLLAKTDFLPLMKSIRATHLVHLAWCTEHGEYKTSPVNQDWVPATVRLAEAFILAGGQGLVAAGSCAEYDWSSGNCSEEHLPRQSSSPYGAAKAEARSQVTALCSQGEIPCAWGRIFFPYGTGEDRRRLIPSLIDALQGKRPAFGVQALARRDFLHASDVASALLALLYGQAIGTYNLCSGEPTALADVVRKVARILHADPQVVLDLPTRQTEEPILLVGDNRRLRHLGWKPKITLAEGLYRTISEMPAAIEDGKSIKGRPR